jgi:hypothetical protein
VTTRTRIRVGIVTKSSLEVVVVTVTAGDRTTAVAAAGVISVEKPLTD